jgi:hypothetical protein
VQKCREEDREECTCWLSKALGLTRLLQLEERVMNVSFLRSCKKVCSKEKLMDREPTEW